MSEPRSHFVFGTIAPFSHVPPVIEVSLALLTHTPDLCISVILHVNNLENSQSLIETQGVAEHVKSRIKLIPVGEKRAWNDLTGSYIDVIYKGGEGYEGVLLDSAPWPHPSTFIYDGAGFFWISVKSKVEENFPQLRPPKLVAYGPLPIGEMLYLAGSEQNGSTRFINNALEAYPEVQNAPQSKLLQGDLDVENSDFGAQAAHLLKQADAYKALLSGWQECTTAPEAWITCFPASVLEPETLEAFRKDEYFTARGKKEVIELGWSERRPKIDLGQGVREFLDKQRDKSVIYISFGTLVDAGPTLPALFDLLKEINTPYIYACGRQKHSLPQYIKDTLASSEKEGICIAPDWLDQVGVLSHKAVSCFVSHCGANSYVEAIEAGVPIIAWGKRGDQVTLASRVHSSGLGIELLQHRTGFSIGKEVAHRKGVIIKGTPEALKEEVRAALDTINGPEGEEMRKRARKLSEEMSEKRRGEWVENIKKFGLYGRE
uniref:UDP-glycosyltransferases domain-containing protein n=1 Tax=Kwoniella bestiolae CBS 10118 TaxID=1296100 RepID=A0A1B9FR97_9TREE|nr:hypothetical protein I302_08959 [Kwoniella bestiolae CBS 10118]OCF21286.1 hypothetical protein I302_08959 [Kwoniella bestiolae CBS 10118]